MPDSKIEQLKNWIFESNRIVFFGGAGVSTESGIPDFRSPDGIYQSVKKYPPEVMLSHSFFLEHTKEFFEYYKSKMIHLGIQPNITHKKLAQLETEGKLLGIITQNIDGLHQKAGSKKVIELHGSIYRNYCMRCNRFYELEDILQKKDVPYCSCSGLIKPEVVLYEEPLNDQAIHEAIDLIRQAELLIIGGTSLSVYPAAGLIRYYKGDQLVMINKETTSYDREINLLIKASLGEIFKQL